MAFTPLNALSSFLAVARRRSFAAAARDLGLSTSALSQSVRQLEARLGVPLLTRTSRTVALTDAGQRLLENAGPALDQALESLPQAPQDLLQHDCLCVRSDAGGARYAWELERGKKEWRVPVQRPVTTNDPEFMRLLAGAGVGLLYAFRAFVDVARERASSSAPAGASRAR